jgi:hypothetical protein
MSTEKYLLDLTGKKKENIYGWFTYAINNIFDMKSILSEAHWDDSYKFKQQKYRLTFGCWYKNSYRKI